MAEWHIFSSAKAFKIYTNQMVQSTEWHIMPSLAEEGSRDSAKAEKSRAYILEEQKNKIKLENRYV